MGNRRNEGSGAAGVAAGGGHGCVVLSGLAGRPGRDARPKRAAYGRRNGHWLGAGAPPVHVTTEVANAQMPDKARETGMPPAVCAALIVEHLLRGTREAFFPAVWKPFPLPGFLAFIGASLVPETMERLAQDNYGKDFVRPIDKANPLDAKK